MPSKIKFYVIITTFLSLFPIYFLLMVFLEEDNLFRKFAVPPSGFLMVSGILLFFAFAAYGLLDLIIDLKRFLIKPRVGKVLVLEGYITKEELEVALSQQSLKFGEVLVNEGRITREQLNLALDIQKEVPKKIGDILKEMKYVSDEDIDWALAKMKRRIGRVLLDMGLLADYEIAHALFRQRKRGAKRKKRV